MALGMNNRADDDYIAPPFGCFPGRWDVRILETLCLDGVNSGRSKWLRAVQRWTVVDAVGTRPRGPLSTRVLVT